MRIEKHRHAPQMGFYQGLHADGLDYHVLYDAAQMIKGVPGLTCELGVRRGGSTALMIQACIDNDDKRIHVGIDPFGNIEFYHPHAKNGEKMRSDWTNRMKQESLPALFEFCNQREYEFIFFNIESTEFFNRFSDGVPVYNEYKRLVNEYALVYFDAPPSPDGATKIEEAEFFRTRTPKGGMFVFDDVKIYNHQPLHDKLVNEWGFALVDAAWKWSYKKIV